MAFHSQIKEITFQPNLSAISNEFHEIKPLSSSPQPSTSSAFAMHLISEARHFLHAPANKEKYRRSAIDFSRNRCFRFPSLAISILKDHARPAQDRIIRLFEERAFVEFPTCPTASAFYQARSKLIPAFFHDWTSFIVKVFYSTPYSINIMKKFHGRFVWSIDGSYLTLPDTVETRAMYTVHKNNVPGSETIQALASVAYDVLNDFPVSASLGVEQYESNFIPEHYPMVSTCAPIILYDRAYASYDTIARTLDAHADFVIRCPLSQTFKVVEDFLASDKTDETVMLYPQPAKKRLAKKCGWPLEVEVRLVKVVLDDGTIEILMTSLLDREEYPACEFKWLYGIRWGVETGLYRFKVQLEVECFSSGKAWNIMQDFHATIFLQALESIINKAIDHDIIAKSQENHSKFEYHVNKSVAYTTVSIHLVSLFLLDQKALELAITAIQHEVRLCATPIRPGRHNLREIPKVSKSLKYHKYWKKRR